MPPTNDQLTRLAALTTGDVLRSAHVEAIAAVLGEFDTAVVELIQHKLVEQMQSKRNERILAEIEEQNRLAKQIGDEALRLQAENAALREALAALVRNTTDSWLGVNPRSHTLVCRHCAAEAPYPNEIPHAPDCPVARALLEGGDGEQS